MQDSTPPGMNFLYDFLQNNGGTPNENGGFGIFRRDFSIDAPLGVYTLPVVEKISLEIRPEVCYLPCYWYTVTRCAIKNNNKGEYRRGLEERVRAILCDPASECSRQGRRDLQIWEMALN